MWDMTEEEVKVYKRFELAFPWSAIKDDCDKYGLMFLTGWGQCMVPHGLVCKFLNEHKEIAERWVRKEILYHDVLDLAEQLYFGLPLFKERH